MKILLLGANGMLAQAVKHVFQDHEVIGYDRPEIDITSQQSVHEICIKEHPEAIINCAAYTAVDLCETEEQTADLVNGVAVGILAQESAALDVPIVHISTDYVFDGLNENGYREDDQPGSPLNAYGRTKLHGEQLLQQHATKYYLVRTSWLYGPGGKNFVTTILSHGRTKPQLKVINDQHGKPTYTRDLAQFILDLLTDKAPYGIYHGVNEEATTWYDFTKEIFSQENLATPVEPCDTTAYPLPAKRPHWSILLNTKRPVMRSWKEALTDYLHLVHQEVL